MKMFKSFSLLIGFALCAMFISCDQMTGKDGPGKDEPEKGTPVVSSDNVMTVTPQSDGLLVNLNLTEKPWKYLDIKVRDETTGRENVFIKTERALDTPSLEILYPFVEKNHEYIVWVSHMDDGWLNWNENKDIAPKITAKGGLGNFCVHSSGMEYKYTTTSREITIKDFELISPDSLKNHPYTINGNITEVKWFPDENNQNVKDEDKPKDITIYPGAFTMEGNKILLSQNTQAVEFVRGRSNLRFDFAFEFTYKGLNYTFPVVEGYNNTMLFNDPEILPDKVIWTPANGTEKTFITVSADAWESEGYIKNDFAGDAPVIYFENGIDLTGYKYLNIEAYSPDDGYHLLGFAGISNEPYEKVARIQAMGSKQPTVYQTDFGVNNKEWPDANSVPFQVKKSTSNIMNHMIIYSFDPFDEGTQDVPGVKICIKKITATNTKLTNDTSKDRVIFKATESGGHKFTTVNEDDERWETNFLYFGTNLDLEGYKYLNLEVCSPNCGNYSVNIESWNTSYKTDCERVRKLEFSKILTSEMTVYQIPFGVFKEYWFDWTVNENYKKTIKDNILTYLYVSTQDTEKDWQWHGGVDVYLKSITATNTLLETPDTSKDKVVYSAIEPEGRKITTKDGWAYLDIGYYNLKGYDYLNFEIASPNSDFNVVNIYARDYCNNVVGHLESILTQGYNVIQIPFGKDKGTWEKWIGNTSSTVSFATNELRSLAIWATDQNAQNWPNVKDVDIYIKSITATNKKLEERVVFEAPSSSEGYKITTEKNWVDFYLGYSNLKGFKYLNIELYSPNNNNYAIEIDGWGGSPRENVADFANVNLTENPTIIQVDFGTSREYWNAWVADKNDFEQRPTNSDDLNHFAIGARDSNSQLVEGIDIYIKRIWATNTELK